MRRDVIDQPQLCLLYTSRFVSETGADGGGDAEVRFARFFHSTPMAIATVDEAGAILHSNAAFARLIPAVLRPRTIHDLVASGAGLNEALADVCLLYTSRCV